MLRNELENVNAVVTARGSVTSLLPTCLNAQNSRVGWPRSRFTIANTPPTFGGGGAYCIPCTQLIFENNISNIFILREIERQL